MQQQATVRCPPTDDNLQIAILLAGRQRFMERPKIESLGKTLARIQKNAVPAPGMCHLASLTAPWFATILITLHLALPTGQ